MTQSTVDARLFFGVAIIAFSALAMAGMLNRLLASERVKNIGMEFSLGLVKAQMESEIRRSLTPTPKQKRFGR